MLAFIGGMLAVPLAYPLQRYVFNHFGGIDVRTLFVWAVIEEVLKYIAVGFTALRSRDYDEPIDAMVYLVTTALGFAALENAVFILDPALHGNVLRGFLTGNERFIGASLLHVVSSAVLGYCIGREFFRPKIQKAFWRVIGLSLAIGLHTVFNVFIIYQNGGRVFLVFGAVWMMALVILLLFEKIKAITN
jgi:RsiW-degrading membrane proteinase PrsW (M82 family)